MESGPKSRPRCLIPDEWDNCNAHSESRDSTVPEEAFSDACGGPLQHIDTSREAGPSGVM